MHVCGPDYLIIRHFIIFLIIKYSYMAYNYLIVNRLDVYLYSDKALFTGTVNKLATSKLVPSSDLSCFKTKNRLD